MTRPVPGEDGLGRALAGLSGEHPDVGDILAHLMVDCAASCGARAVAVLARVEPAGSLELLAASSHRAAEMEVWQAQHGAGPCIEAMDAARVVHRTAEAAGLEEGSLGALMRDAGFRAVSAYPVAWRGITLAGLNLFWSTDPAETPVGEAEPDAGPGSGPGSEPGSEPVREPGLVYADLVALAIAHPALTDPQAVQAQLRRSMTERALVEQAKGVLAWTEGVDMGAAYARLLELTAASSATLTEVATEVVRRRGAPPV